MKGLTVVGGRCMRADERVIDISMWKEELLAEIRADEVEMENTKVL